MAIVTIEGTITSIELKEKDEKVSTELLLAQRGQKMQTPVRLEGDQTEMYSEFENASFTGDLLTWKTRDSVGMMVLVRE